MAFAYDLFDRGALLRIGLPIAVSYTYAVCLYLYAFIIYKFKHLKQHIRIIDIRTRF